MKFYFLLIFALTFSFSAFGQTSDCADRDFDCRIAAATRLIQSKPNDADAYITRANAYDEKGEFDKAIADYNQALKINPKSWLAYYNRGLAYTNHGKQTEALADYTKVIELDPQNARAYHDRANIYDDTGKFELAIADYNKAVEIQPDYTLAYLNRAVAYYRKKDWAKALVDLDKVTELDPGYVHPYVARAEIYEKLGDLEKSRFNRERSEEIKAGTFSVKPGTKSELRETASSIYKSGQMWSYQTRPGEEKSTFIVLKVENHPVFGNIVHIALDNLKLNCPANSDDCTVSQAQHLPFSEAAITKSAVKMLKENVALPDYQEGYKLWREAFDAKRAGIYTASIADAVKAMESTLNQ